MELYQRQIFISVEHRDGVVLQPVILQFMFPWPLLCKNRDELAQRREVRTDNQAQVYSAIYVPFLSSFFHPFLLF
jgi:hypothetical protein